MASYTFTPPIDCGRTLPAALARKTTRTQSTRNVAGVRLTKTTFGWSAQGLQLDLVEDSATYWTTTLPGNGGKVDGRTLERLVKTLVDGGHLTKDAKR
jgi:hypothetical protein